MSCVNHKAGLAFLGPAGLSWGEASMGLPDAHLYVSRGFRSLGGAGTRRRRGGVLEWQVEDGRISTTCFTEQERMAGGNLILMSKGVI